MLTIRNEQMLALADAVEEQFLENLVRYIRATEPTAGPPLSEGTLRTMVGTGVRRARRHGLSAQNSLAAFVVLMFQLGPSFDTWPSVAKVLDDPGIHPDDRLEVLAERVTVEDLEGIARSYDMSAWFAV